MSSLSKHAFCPFLARPSVVCVCVCVCVWRGEGRCLEAAPVCVCVAGGERGAWKPPQKVFGSGPVKEKPPALSAYSKLSQRGQMNTGLGARRGRGGRGGGEAQL